MADAPQFEARPLIEPKTVFGVLGVLLLLWFIYHTRVIMILLFFSLVLAASLYPAVQWLKRRHFPSRLGILVFYLLFIALVGAAGFFLVDMLIKEGREFAANFPDYMQAGLLRLEGLPFVPVPETLLANLYAHMEQLVANALQVLASTLDYLRILLSGMVGIVTILVLTYYLLSDLPHFECVVFSLIPASRQAQARRLLQGIAGRIGAYLRGQIALMSVIGLTVWIGLSLLGVPYAYILGLVSFFLEIIPIVGPVVGAAIGILIALSQEPMLALWTGLFYVGLQQLENFILAPRILGHSVKLHPFWVFLAILLGGALMGIPGVLLAVPVAVIVRVVVDEFYIRGWLASRGELSPDTG